MRELIERELVGKVPSPAVGEAVQGLARLVVDNVKLITSVLVFSVGAYQALLRSEMLSHPERAQEIARLHRQFVEGLLKDFPSPELFTVDIGFRVSDLAQELERFTGEEGLK